MWHNIISLLLFIHGSVIVLLDSEQRGDDHSHRLGINLSTALYGSVLHTNVLSQCSRTSVAASCVKSRFCVPAALHIVLQRVHDPLLVPAVRTRLYDACQTNITVPQLLSEYVLSSL